MLFPKNIILKIKIKVYKREKRKQTDILKENSNL